MPTPMPIQLHIHPPRSLLLLVCALLGTILGAGVAPAEDWPQWRGPNRDGRWQAEGLMSELPDGQLPLEWSVAIGSGYSGPTVADGRVYVMDRQGTADKQSERVLCFDSKTGAALWQHSYESSYKIGYTAGPRASVTIDRGVAYAVGAMGHMHALDAAKGSIIWQHDLEHEYDINMPIWGIAASPLVYRDLVIQQVGGSNKACVVAFDRTTGKEMWRALDERAGYSSPIVVQQAGQDVLVCWTGDALSGLDPLTGKLYWSEAMPSSKMPIGITTPSVDGDLVFVSSFYDGSLMVRLLPDKLAIEKVWRRVGKSEQKTDSLHAMIGTPIVANNYVYGVDSYGEFRCLDAQTGDRIWESQEAVPRDRWSTVHMVRQADRVWMFNERGELMIAKLSPKGLEILDRCQVIEPTKIQLPQRGGVVWTHPAFAEKSIFVRNDERLIRASLKAPAQ
jgi:outer membrane protein assembly factor BamB